MYKMNPLSPFSHSRLLPKTPLCPGNRGGELRTFKLPGSPSPPGSHFLLLFSMFSRFQPHWASFKTPGTTLAIPLKTGFSKISSNSLYSKFYINASTSMRPSWTLHLKLQPSTHLPGTLMPPYSATFFPKEIITLKISKNILIMPSIPQG